MGKFEKFASTEHSIRRQLATLAQLESEYVTARVEEINDGIFNTSKPFLRSRALKNQIKTVIKKLRAIENTHNRYASVRDNIHMVERIIFEEKVFVLSREILEGVLQHSAVIKAGIARAHDELEPEFQGGYSPIASKAEKRAEILAIIEQQKTKNKTSTAQDDAVSAILNASKEEGENNE